jgi:hypothetical protein
MQARTATAAATGPSQLALLSTCSARFTVASAATTMPVAARAVSSSGAQVLRCCGCHPVLVRTSRVRIAQLCQPRAVTTGA